MMGVHINSLKLFALTRLPFYKIAVAVKHRNKWWPKYGIYVYLKVLDFHPSKRIHIYITCMYCSIETLTANYRGKPILLSIIICRFHAIFFSQKCSVRIFSVNTSFFAKKKLSANIFCEHTFYPNQA